MPRDPHRGPDDRPLVGRVLGGTYEVERPLGAGGMGAVYVARHVRTGRRYAVKVLLRERALTEENTRRFRREAKALGALGHAGIIAVHDFAESDDGLAYIVMDLLEGEDLASRLRRGGALPWPEIQRIGQEVAAALGAAHAVGILHRDLKPGNIFLWRQPGAPDRAVLLDFGLAKATDAMAQTQLTSTGEVLGTPLYMAPEQARGDELDGRADLYALGVVLFEMVTGTPPFSGPNVTAVLARLLTEPPPSVMPLARTPVPAELDAFLQRALAKRPADRFPNPPEFAGALARAAQGSPQGVADPALAMTVAGPGLRPSTPAGLPAGALHPTPAPPAGPDAAPPAIHRPTPAQMVPVPPVPLLVTGTSSRRRPALLAVALAMPVVLATLAGVGYFAWRGLTAPAQRSVQVPRAPSGVVLVAVDGGPTPYLDLRVAMSHAGRNWRLCLDAVPPPEAGLGTLQTQVNCAFQAQDLTAMGRICDELQRRFPDDVATPTCRQTATQLERLLAATPRPKPGAQRPVVPAVPAPSQVPAPPAPPVLPGMPVLPTAPLPPTLPTLPTAPLPPRLPKLPTLPGVPALPPHLATAAEHQKHGRFRDCVAAARRGPATEQSLNWQFGCAAFVNLAEVKQVCAETERRLPATHAFVKRCRSHVSNLEAAPPAQVP
ncbi:MAG: serine/threonine protein kinase [Deltaproteobacteria bacterium]|nr:serine/threonine protein kinase [Deltaproteobacteria bacterium]